MRRYAFVTVFVIGMSFSVLAAEQPSKKTPPLHYTPRLGEMMVTTQLRHFKLWYSGTVKNWKLANYELAQIRAVFDETTKLYPDLPGADMSVLTRPTDEVGRAIELKDGIMFRDAFDRLTTACNSCHKAAGVGFIVIKEPTLSPIQTSPFSDESFLPQ